MVVLSVGDARNISVHFIASYLHQLEQNSGSVTKVPEVIGDIAYWRWDGFLRWTFSRKEIQHR